LSVRGKLRQRQDVTIEFKPERAESTSRSAANGKVYVSDWADRRPGPGDPADGVHPIVVDSRTGLPRRFQPELLSMK
jgi:hypothetical protein